MKHIFGQIRTKYASQPINTEDGLKIEFDKEWVHLRTSITEPIIRVYSVSKSESTANELAQRIMNDIKQMMQVPA